MTSKTDWKILAKSKFGEFNLMEKYTQTLFIQRIKQSNFFILPFVSDNWLNDNDRG
jgi:hypothetical protein